MCNHKIIRTPTCICLKHAQATNCTNPTNMHKKLSHQSQQYVVMKQIFDMIWMMAITNLNVIS